MKNNPLDLLNIKDNERIVFISDMYGGDQIFVLKDHQDCTGAETWWEFKLRADAFTYNQLPKVTRL